MKKIYIIASVITIAIIIAAVIIIVNRYNAKPVQPKLYGNTSGIPMLVTYSDNGYSPQTLTIKMGQTVTFKNESSEPMWTASNPHPIHTLYPDFDARKPYASGESYSFTFLQKGEWRYHDHLDPSKIGTIIAQ